MKHKSYSYTSFKTFNNFRFRICCISDDLQGGWFNFTKGFEKAAKIETSNILPVKYEDLKLVSV